MTPGCLSNGCSMHQKQPPANVATALPGGAAGSFAICAAAGQETSAAIVNAPTRSAGKSADMGEAIGFLMTGMARGAAVVLGRRLCTAPYARGPKWRCYDYTSGALWDVVTTRPTVMVDISLSSELPKR